jgi:hypothetical protein
MFSNISLSIWPISIIANIGTEIFQTAERKYVSCVMCNNSLMSKKEQGSCRCSAWFKRFPALKSFVI